MQHSLSPVARRVLGTLPVRLALEEQLALSRTALVQEVQAEHDVLFLATLRANLHAAARHAALGHTGPSFRECTGPACVEAAKLIPELDPMQDAATDDELEAILEDVLVNLEREGTSFFAPKPS